MSDPFNAFTTRDPAAGGGVSGTAAGGGVSGSLSGLTAGIKDNIAVKGLPWTAGLALFRNRIATADATVVARLRAAGATILGTLNMNEAALGADTDNPWFGRTLNPHGQGRTAGGSSGGSGAAVAGGLCDFALGTDTLGSVRIPASYCGVYGLKPTNGALPDDGLEPMHRGFDVIGPLARNLNVLERVWQVLSDDDQPAAPARTGRWLTLAGLGGVTCEPAVQAAYDRLCARFSIAGEVTLPPLKAVRFAAFVEAARELGRHLGAARHGDGVSAPLQWLLDYADKAEADPALLADVRSTLRAALGDDGVLVLPTTPQVAFAFGGRAPSNQADFTGIANIAGLPALSLPAGSDEQSMPVGMQMIGPPGSEAMLIGLARTLPI